VHGEYIASIVIFYIHKCSQRSSTIMALLTAFSNGWSDIWYQKTKESLG